MGKRAAIEIWKWQNGAAERVRNDRNRCVRAEVGRLCSIILVVGIQGRGSVVLLYELRNCEKQCNATVIGRIGAELN